MSLNILFADTSAWEEWRAPLADALSQRRLDCKVHCDRTDPDNVDVIVHAPSSGLMDFSPYRRLKAILSTWAGVERIATNPTIKVPLTRMVDPGLTAGMVEYCIGHVMRYHLNLDAHIKRKNSDWQPELLPPLAQNRRVGVLGLGALGQAVAKAASSLNSSRSC